MTAAQWMLYLVPEDKEAGETKKAGSLAEAMAMANEMKRKRASK